MARGQKHGRERERETEAVHCAESCPCENDNFPIHPLTFTDESILGDGLLTYITALDFLEGLKLEIVCVDTLQLLRLRGDRERKRLGRRRPG